MNIEGAKSQLGEYFKNGNVKFVSFIDAEKKQISAKITHPEVNIVEVVNVNIFPQENCVILEMTADNRSIFTIDDTYNNSLGLAFTQWFKPILRDIVNNKYELEGVVISDELLGTDYCQVRSDGIMPFVNLTEMPKMEFTIL